MDDVQWLLAHSEDTPASPEFAWKYWTDVTHWVDPPATFTLEGPFEAGASGMTVFPDREPLHWSLQEVMPGLSYTIASALEGALILWHWRFDARPGGGTTLTQRIGVSGAQAARHAEGIRGAFEPSLARAMKRVAVLLSVAEARVESRPG